MYKGDVEVFESQLVPPITGICIERSYLLDVMRSSIAFGGLWRHCLLVSRQETFAVVQVRNAAYKQTRILLILLFRTTILRLPTISCCSKHNVKGSGV